MSFSGILAAEVERAAVLARAKAAAETTRPRKRELVLRVDTREANNDDLMYELRLAYARAGMADRIQVATLNLFDFEFAVRDTGDEFGPKIERKTPGDLEASVMDGRFAEQKARMHAAEMPQDKKIYLIEGDVPAHNFRLQRMAATGAMLKPVLRRENNLVIAGNAKMTALLLAEWHVYLEQVDEPHAVAHYAYAQNVQARVRKCEFRADRRLAMMITSFVDGASPAFGEAVARLYPSIGALQLAFLHKPRTTLEAIATLKPEGNQRCIGPEVAKRIRDDLCDIPVLAPDLEVDIDEPDAPPKRTRGTGTKRAKRVKRDVVVTIPDDDDDDDDE
jgi:ERCC4-type nuclease